MAARRELNPRSGGVGKINTLLIAAVDTNGIAARYHKVLMRPTRVTQLTDGGARSR